MTADITVILQLLQRQMPSVPPEYSTVLPDSHAPDPTTLYRSSTPVLHTMYPMSNLQLDSRTTTIQVNTYITEPWRTVQHQRLVTLKTHVDSLDVSFFSRFNNNQILGSAESSPARFHIQVKFSGFSVQRYSHGSCIRWLRTCQTRNKTHGGPDPSAWHDGCTTTLCIAPVSIVACQPGRFTSGRNSKTHVRPGLTGQLKTTSSELLYLILINNYPAEKINGGTEHDMLEIWI